MKPHLRNLPFPTANKSIRLLLVLGLALGLLAFLQAPAAAQSGGRDPAPNPNVAAIETDYLMGMVPHHRGAVMMAEMALTKATRPELRTLAQKIIDSQQIEAQLMTNWLRDWYGMEPPAGHMMSPAMMDKMDMPMMHGMMPDMAARMRALETKTGAAFDVEFLSGMIDHHAMAVMMSAPMLIAGHHQDLNTLAAEIVIDQGEEIKQMQAWLDTWYGVKSPLMLQP